VNQARLHVDHKDIAGSIVLTLTGEIDIETTWILAHALADAAAAHPPAVIVDLAAVSFMDSTGLTTLLVAHRNLTGQGSRIALAQVRQPVLRVLDLTGVDTVIPLYASVDQALQT
jgi:anti-anti-sigma factor